MRLKNLLLMSCLAIATTTFCACGGSNDDEVENNGNVGVHKIELSMDGDLNKFTPVVCFVALSEKGSYQPLYNENGTFINDHAGWLKDYADNPYTYTSAYSTNNCWKFYVQILLSNPGNNSGTVTINATGTLNGKLKSSKSKTITFSPSDEGKTLMFESLNGFVLDEFFTTKFIKK